MKAKKYTKETITQIGVVDKGYDQFGIGDTVKVAQRIKEGNKERTQIFEGDVIAIHKKGIASTFTVRKISSSAVAVERIFPYYSPNIESVKFVHKGKVRRAKLYYMRERIGKAARVKEKLLTKEQKELLEEKNQQGSTSQASTNKEE